MKCIILAAGYATRLYPLTENFPKPLLEVCGKAILDWIVDDLEKSELIDEFIVVSNHKFVDHFELWASMRCEKAKITVLDDGTEDNAHRLGAVRDIAFAVEQCHVTDDVMVVAGDNLTDFSLHGFIDYFLEKRHTCSMRHYEADVNKLRKTGVIEIDECEMVLQMQEKPMEPVSNWAVPPFYIYVKEDLPKIFQAVTSGVCNVDAPGDFIAWLCGESEVYAYLMPGTRYDIGDLASYERVQEVYKSV